MYDLAKGLRHGLIKCAGLGRAVSGGRWAAQQQQQQQLLLLAGSTVGSKHAMQSESPLTGVQYRKTHGKAQHKII